MDYKLKTFKLISGCSMPVIGLGTYKITGRKHIKDILDSALSAGYRSIDTATVYQNEEDIGLALNELLPKYKLKREDIFITSKLAPSDHGELALDAVKKSLEKLNCGYLDLYLIHWPGQQGSSPKATTNTQARSKTWEQLTVALKQGLVKNIGVSNYTVNHLVELLANCFNVKPALNQVEWHPHYHQPELIALCKREGILLQAYSSLGGSKNPALMSDPNVLAVAKKLNKHPAQVLLCWALQQDVAIIPKASSLKHMEDNINIDFNIPDDDIHVLNNLKQQKYSWDPTVVK